ncbi:MAG: endolytic transglycosylase MltG [Lachnospira sp.]
MSNKTIRMIISLSLNLLLVVIGVYIIFTVGSSAYSFGNKIFNEKAVDTADNARVVEVTIKDGVTAKELSKILYDKGLVKDKTVTYFQISLSDYNNKFTAGTYELNTGMKPTEMMEAMSSSGSSDSK